MDRKDYFVGIFSAYFECYVVVSLDSIREAFKKMCCLVLPNTGVTPPLPLKRFGQVMVIFSDHDMDSIVSGYPLFIWFKIAV